MVGTGKEKRDGVLDLLKVVATFCIVLHHYQQSTGAKWQNFNFWDDEHFYFGYLVELFFLISGIVCFSDIEKIRSGLTLRSYWLRRYFRFLPMVALSVVCYEGVVIFFQMSTGTALFGREINLGGMLVSALSLQCWAFLNPGINNPIWYISVLLLCYLILFIIVKISEKYSCWDINYSLIIMILLGCAIVVNGWNYPLLNLYTGRGFYAFFLGILLKEVMNRWRSASRYIISGSIFVIFSLALVFLPDITRAGVIEWYGANLFLLFLYFPAIILFLDNPLLTRLLSRRWTKLLANISLGVFVWHSVIHDYFVAIMVTNERYYDVSAMVIVLLVLLLDYIAGVISYYLFEKILIKKMIPNSIPNGGEK